MIPLPHQLSRKMKQPDNAGVLLGFLFSEFGCVDAVIGSDYEVTDANGKLLARVRRRPITVQQLNELNNILYEFKLLQKKSNKKK